MDLKNCIILITGSADRVGKTIAFHLARKGAQVIVHYHTNTKKAQQTAAKIAEIGRPPLIVNGDLTKKDVWIGIRDEILSAFGRIDVLVNNAAIFKKTPFLETTEAQWDLFMDVNLKSVFLGSQIFGESMKRQKNGKIINMADISAERVWPSYIPYCVSKAGVVTLTRGLARVLAPHVTVNAIAPGAVLLPENFDKKQKDRLIDKTPLKRIGSPKDVAQTVEFLIENGDFITGTVIPIDGGRLLT